MKKYKNLIDQKIQEAVDRRSSSTNQSDFQVHEDVELYHSIFKILDDEPEIKLSDDFAITTMEVAYKKKMIRDVLWRIALYSGVSLTLITVCVLAGIVMDPEIFWKMVGSLKNNSAYLVFAVAIFISIQTLDKILIKNKISQTGT